ncbi:5-demethoxyubiquinol-8 5-hydroxylase UbiM [Falsiroseomonas tokyonensis]|uniref:5-demethoxyubiquinol-8 5-hydroxylase UbiM n=1 Tax=Falsiroseomonas tokyonensis TaxID=430521 RepID=A0ABV7BW11_9PROT|nr:5-demethoxyubiquinol-8 5-hydroxylase UbiM [Falsiroseomonas tokyonensis]MBU8539054.1 5-demethoxyubiquinol-8 5-hydroxylase UbiM [Falsiroseomonas tokyonensis]
MKTDIAIIGAGPAGLSLAAALAGAGHRITLLERAPEKAIAEPAFDGREIALTHRSQAILRAIGAWDRIPAAETAPLLEAKVLDGGNPLALRFAPGQTGEPLGRLVPNQLIRRALFETVAGTEARLVAGRGVTGLELGAAGAVVTLQGGERVAARLVVAADSRFSETRRLAGIGAAMLDFGRSMIVARVAHEAPHGGVATEWFGHGQTIAMLPLNGEMSSVVLTLAPKEAEAAMAMAPEAFGAEVTRRYQGRLGRMTLAGTRHLYPLVAAYAHRFAGRRFALLGDAAVGMHPVTAHGFNFGLSGAETLAGQLRGASDPGAVAGLFRYASSHRAATLPLFLATNAVARLYSDDRAPARLARAALLGAGSVLAPVRRAIVARLMDAPAAARV